MISVTLVLYRDALKEAGRAFSRSTMVWLLPLVILVTLRLVWIPLSLLGVVGALAATRSHPSRELYGLLFDGLLLVPAAVWAAPLPSTWPDWAALSVSTACGRRDLLSSARVRR